MNIHQHLLTSLVMKFRYNGVKGFNRKLNYNDNSFV